ncbi:MAG: anthranilate phosphoribosyltransferase [Paracoccaceae bacterium]|jgi:anthranilate phosphoribosyltransferase
MQEPHPFARFVAILGRGKTKQRHLTLAESHESMAMILRGEAVAEQIGAFLMLLRLKEEAPEEIAGFALGARETFDLPKEVPHVDIDWSSYAGKRIQLPWFLLSALTLAGAGYKVFMHGTDGHTPGRVYTQQTLEKLGFPIAESLTDAVDHLATRNFAYTPLKVLSPRLHDMIQLRPILGLRTPVHSFSRMLNPFNAPVMMQGIFHRGFMDVHAGAARLLAQPHMAVFRGEGGEIERRPNKPTLVYSTNGDSEPASETWPALLSDAHQPVDSDMNTEKLIAIWRGEETAEYAIAAITGTLAIALKAMGKASSIDEAEKLAQRLWAERARDTLPLK